jgi:hypothetical protein
MRQLTILFILPPYPFVTLTTVLGLVLLDPGDGHGHPVGKMLFLRRGQAPEPGKGPQPVARLLELRFQSRLLGTAYRKEERGRHRAPVENDEEESSMRANKRQTLFFALVSP